MKTSQLVRACVVIVACSIVSTAQAITYGEPDVNGEFPNVVFLRGILESTPPFAQFNCSGSLLHIDADRIVFLTAAHCTDIWKDEIAAGRLDTVGVSFDQDNLVPGNVPGLTRYVRGGVPISLPEKDAPFENLDYGLVVFSTADTNRAPAGQQTITDRWGSIPGALTPVQVPLNENYVPGLLNRGQHATALLSFTAVGYGTGERFPIPGQGGPANPNDPNNATLRIRYIAARLSYNAYNPTKDVLRLSQNIALGQNGTCTGDSGGPIFNEDGPLGRVQVALVSGGDNVCRATTAGPAFSRQEAFDFLSCAATAIIPAKGLAGSVIDCVEKRFGVGSAPKK
jgi:Trypsin